MTHQSCANLNVDNQLFLNQPVSCVANVIISMNFVFIIIDTLFKVT